MDMLLNHRPLPNHKVLLNQKMRHGSARADAGRAKGAAHNTDTAVARRRQQRQRLHAAALMGAE